MPSPSSSPATAAAAGQVCKFTAESDATERFDVWLAARLPNLSRARIQALIRAGDITVDGQAAREHRRLKAGQNVSVIIPAPRPAMPPAQDIPLDIIYQDADIIVVNKPAGIVVHPAAGHAAGTLVNALLHHCPDLAGIGGELRPGIVHRLDRDTSGLLVAAKNEAALNNLAGQFKNRQVRKEYLALVRGAPPAQGAVDAAIGRHPTQRKKMALTAKGRPARTTFKRLALYRQAALVRLQIHTGRTHQIRVHMAHLGHPVLGDQTYGRHNAAGLPAAPARQMLHAARLGFLHPATGRPMEFAAPLPDDMRAMIRRLKKEGLHAAT